MLGTCHDGSGSCLQTFGKCVCSLLCYHVMAINICGSPIVLVLILFYSVPGYGSWMTCPISTVCCWCFKSMCDWLQAYLLWIICFKVCMVAAIPIMIIEKQSALESMKGSYGLSRGHHV